MRRSTRLLGHAVAFVLFTLAGVATLRFLLDALRSEGMGPGALFGFLLVTGALALIWRSALGLRDAYRRYRS